MDEIAKFVTAVCSTLHFQRLPGNLFIFYFFGIVQPFKLNAESNHIPHQLGKMHGNGIRMSFRQTYAFLLRAFAS
jgi:hypothetical protein